MEGSGNSTPEIVDLEEELKEAASAPVVVVDLEEEDDDDIIILDDNLQVSSLRAVSPEFKILAINPGRPPTEVIDDLCSDSDLDSDVEVLETSLSSSPVVIAVEEEAGVASPSLELSGAFSLSVLEQELPEVSPPATVSMADIKKDKEPNEIQLGDVKSVVESLVQVTVSESGNSTSTTSEGVSSDPMQLLGALGLSPQPSSSKGVLSTGNLSVNSEGHSAEIMRGGNTGVPVERVGGTAKPRIVYIPKPDYSQMSQKEKADLRDQLLRKMLVLQGQCKLGQDYRHRYPPGFIKTENGCKTVVIKDKDGVERQLIFKDAECREADERKADPAFELPPRPTPTYLEMLLRKMPDNLEKKKEKLEGPAWDSKKDVFKFCQDLNAAFDGLVKENEDKKKAKAEARIRKKEDRKKAMMAEIEHGGRQTRLSTGAITRKVVMAKHSSASANSSPVLKNQLRKRKGSEMGTSSETDFSPVPPLCRRPLSRPGPSVAPIPPPPPTPEPETSQSAEERLSSSPSENKAGWIKEDVWEIEGIVDVKVEKDDATGRQRFMYMVKWKDWDSTHNSWVADKHIITKTTIKTFWRRFKKSLSNLNAQQRIPVTGRVRSLKTTGYFLP